MDSTAALKRKIAERGEPVTLRRAVTNGQPIEVQTMAFVRGYRPEEIAAGITLNHSLAILAPDALLASGLDPIARKGDYLVIAGRPRYVDAANILREGTTPVRLELAVAG